MFSVLFNRRLHFMARKNVENLRQEHPQFDQQQLGKLLIRQRAKTCAFIAALTAVPAFAPGWGTLVAVIAGISFDIAVISVLLYRLSLELAIVYGQDLSSPEVQKEALKAFLLATGFETLRKKATYYAAYKGAGSAAWKFITPPFLQIGFRLSQRAIITRIIPVLGVGLAGTITYLFTRTLGNRIMAHYGSKTENNVNVWGGHTIDAEYKLGDAE